MCAVKIESVSTMTLWFRFFSVGALLAASALGSNGFVLVSSQGHTAGSGSGAASEEVTSGSPVFATPGAGLRFHLTSTLLLKEAGGARAGSDVGFQLTGDVVAGTVWRDPTHPARRLLWMQISDTQLHIKSRKAPKPEGFVAHSSRLQELPSAPAFALLEDGSVPYVWTAKGEDSSLVNIKKAVASAFQFKVEDWRGTEKDASGRCEVTYSRIDPRTILKKKEKCVNGKQVPHLVHPDPLLGANVTSSRVVKLLLSSSLEEIEMVEATEYHQMVVIAKPEAASMVSSSLELQRKGSEVLDTIEASNLEDALHELEKRTKKEYNKQITILDRESPCGEDCPSLSKLVKEHHDDLAASAVGTLRSTKAFTRLLAAVRIAKKEDIVKVLKSSKNKDILEQLCDVVGAAQTAAAHEAAMKVLRLDADEDERAAERYLWALSFGAHPLPHVAKDILRRSELPGHSAKMEETLLLTAAALANRLRSHPIHHNHKVVEEAEGSLLRALEGCADDACQLRLLRALRNLRSPAALPQLLTLAETGRGRVPACALRALRALPESAWGGEEAQRVALRVFAQRRRRHDSSARTLALDLLLEKAASLAPDAALDAAPDALALAEALHVVAPARNDSAYEVRRYLWQRAAQLAQERPALGEALAAALAHPLAQGVRANWDALALRGVSTALTRPLAERAPSAAGANASISTVQEAAGGLLRRGAVDVRLHRHERQRTLFSLGIFAGGLGSFVSSSSSGDEEPGEAEAATAGLELTVLDVGIRPFVFFSGQGELMGHVWSGTASERTPAFQVLTLLQDHQQSVPLQTGFVAELSLLGAASFDLAGQIQLSLWNRNAKSMVEQNVALLLQGQMRVDSSLVRSHVLFHVASEPRLELASDVDFYDKVALCMQLRQPDALVRHNVHKVERILGSKHRLRKSKYHTVHVPGKTYALNRQNNEMCSTLFADK